MNSTPQTRFRGWHVRKYKEMEHSRGVAYTSEIWFNSERVGDGSNEGNGGMDRIYLSARRSEWDEAEAYFNSVPTNRDSTGETFPSETGFFQFLLDNFEADKVLKRARKQGAYSALAGYQYTEQYGFIHAEPVVVPFRTTTPVDAATGTLLLRAPEGLVRYVLVGHDNPEIQEMVPPPEQAMSAV